MKDIHSAAQVESGGGFDWSENNRTHCHRTKQGPSGQLRAIGRSATAKHFGIEGKEEAAAYWRHPVLGPRLKQCTELVLVAVKGKTTHDIFGSPDDMKLQSCMTLFDVVASDEPVFSRAVTKFFDGKRDEVTVGLLG